MITVVHLIAGAIAPMVEIERIIIPTVEGSSIKILALAGVLALSNNGGDVGSEGGVEEYAGDGTRAFPEGGLTRGG